MALIGYARCSTTHQDTTAQLDAITTAGVDQLFSEYISGAAPYAERLQLQAAINTCQTGDVLVVAMTTTAYNPVLVVCGALVVEEAGPLSHAGVMARELGLPAVLGAAGAMAAIPDGALVEVDPSLGSVRVLERP